MLLSQTKTRKMCRKQNKAGRKQFFSCVRNADSAVWTRETSRIRPPLKGREKWRLRLQNIRKKMPRSSQLLFFGRKWERAASIRTIGSGLRFWRNAFRRLQVIECQSFSRLSQSQPLGAVFRHRQFSSASCHVHRYEYNTSALFPTISPATDVCLIIYVLSASRFLIV